MFRFRRQTTPTLLTVHGFPGQIGLEFLPGSFSDSSVVAGLSLKSHSLLARAELVAFLTRLASDAAKKENDRGPYDYVCTFPGHYASGMKGVMTVTP
jgi:Copper binding proteins, plastocyanin/azurin family